MEKIQGLGWLFVWSACCAIGSAQAAVDVAQATRLADELTPIGAERAGNADGSIPAWEGGITTAPAGYKPGMFHLDPYADDAIQLEITASNYKSYAKQLTPGQIALFARYPSYKLLVYPTRRSASFPQRTYDYTAKNAASCTLISKGEGVKHCAEGFPFPLPNDAYEAMWNHKLKFKAVTLRRWANHAAPTPSGAYSLVRMREDVLGLYFKPGNSTETIEDTFVYFLQEVESPTRYAGNVLLVHETLDQSAKARQAWVYNPGQRRVRRAPNVAYDNPATASDGLSSNDMIDMFNGAMDRFDWTLAGKREIYVPYNCYRAHSDQTKVADLIRAGHLNQDLIRYELHRVWVVEAKLKADKRHINSRRTFYLDEDSWQILEIDHYDGRGELVRVSEAPTINFYDLPAVLSTLEVHYDLPSGRYIASLLDNEEASPPDFSVAITPEDFSPHALRRRGIR